MVRDNADLVVMNAFKGGAELSGKGRKLWRQMDENLFTLDEQRLDLVVNRVPNGTPQQHDARGKRPPARTDGRLRMQRHQGEVLMLEQQPSRPVLEDITPADPRHA